MVVAIRKPYQRIRVFTQLTTEVLTQQSHADSTDINSIVARFQRTGDMPPNPRGQEAQYVDCTPYSEDLTESYNRAVERLDEAGRLLSERKREEREAAAAKQKEVEEELESLRAYKARSARAEGEARGSEA